MANVAAVPTQGQILVNVDDITLFEPLRQAIGMLKGVVSVKLKRQAKTGMDRAIEDIEKGRVYEAESVEDLIKQCKACRPLRQRKETIDIPHVLPARWP